MNQFVSKWLCNSRVLSSRDKGHSIILGKGSRISGKQARTVQSAEASLPPWDPRSINTQRDGSPGAIDFPFPLLIAFLDEWGLFDQN